MRSVQPVGRALALSIAASLSLAWGNGFAEPLGKVEIGRGEPVEIRALLSGSVATGISPAIEAAIVMAIEDFGPIHGHPVAIRFLDEKCSGAGGRAAAEAVTADARVVGVIGTLCSGAAVEASPILGAAGLAMISPTNTSPRLTSDLAGNASPDRHAGYWRVSNNDLVTADVVARFSYEELGLRRMAAVHDGDAYTGALAHAFASAFRRHGGAVPVIAEVARGQTDMTAVLVRFAAARPDGMFFPLFPAEAEALVRQAATVDALEGMKMIGGAGTVTAALLALPESEGLYFTGPDPGDGANVNQASGRSADDVLAVIEVALGGPPSSTYWAHGYDAAKLLLSAIEKVATAEGGTLTIDRAALREALAGTAGFQGLIGTLTCDRFGDCGTGRSTIRLHENSGTGDPLPLPVVYRGARDPNASRR